MVWNDDPYLSYTGFSKLEECSTAWELEYALKKRPKVEDARNNIHGNVLHNLLEEWINRGEFEPEWFARNVERGWEEQKAREELIMWKSPTDQQEVYDKTAAWAANLGTLLKQYNIDPATCEAEFKANMNVSIGGRHVKLGGKIDVLKTNKAGDKIILDLKASVNRAIMKRDQLVWYSLLTGLRLKNHEQPVACGYILPGLNEVVMHRVTKEEKVDLLNRINAAFTKIENKDFEPNPGSQCFFCPVKHACPAKGLVVERKDGMLDLSTML